MNTQPHEEEGGLKGAMNKMGDAVGGMVGKAAASTAGGHSTPQFLNNAVIGNMYEIEAAQVALERCQSEEIRGFARKMIEDHTTAGHQMKSALRMHEAKDVGDPPMELDDRRRGMVDHLQEAKAEDFDKRYLDQQLAAHDETATLLRTYIENGDNPQLRSWAMGSLPVVERHLEMARRLKGH